MPSKPRFFGVIVVLMMFSPALTGSAAAQTPQADAAREEYQATVKAARQEYLRQMKMALRGAANESRETVRRLREQVEVLELEVSEETNGQVRLAEKHLENTVWRTPSNPKGFLRLLPRNRTINHAGTRGVWMMTDKATALTQSGGTGNIYVFRFQPDLKTAAVHTFKDDKKTRKFRRQ